jgi:GTP-binding protein HflX
MNHSTIFNNKPDAQLNDEKSALIVSVYKGNAADRAICEEHLSELKLLAETYGIVVVDKVVCQVRKK